MWQLLLRDIGLSLAIWTVKPGNAKAFIRAWDDFAKWTAGNIKGARTAVLIQDIEDPQKFISFGPWENRDILMKWRDNPEFKNAFMTFRVLCSGIEPHMMQCVGTTAGK